ncbi:MAG: hypothetical protein LBP81_05375 [Treponema sp.]|jgi:hypothetical protein|nr:hypothetical protein [Treponema sp.]
MKKIFCGALLVTAFLFSRCADPAGLHNQKMSQMTFELVNFPLPDGDYCIPGDYQGTDWDNSKTIITLKNGNGVSSVQNLKKSSVKFTVVQSGAWTRSWYPATQGNAPDETQNNIYWNFTADGIPEDSEVTIVVDGSRKPAEITVH